MKVCDKCGSTERVRCGKYDQCGPCKRAQTRAWNTRNPDRKKELQRRWYTTNKDRHDANSRRWRENNLERAQELEYLAHIRRKYGLSAGDYRAMLVKQDGKCDVCQLPMDRPQVGHDHITKLVQGLQCSNCNAGMGKFADDPALLRRAANYIEAHRKVGV